MKERIVKDKIHALRTDALNNNIIWLKSFGCKVQIKNSLMHIDHQEVTEYKSYLILEPSQKAFKELKKILNRINSVRIKPGIFLDASIKNTSLISALIKKGYERTDINVTMAGIVTQGPERPIFKLQPASLDDIDLWSSLYSESFGRYGKKAEIDHLRWEQAFLTRNEVRHWLILKRKTYIGVCQTCTGCGLVGVYSFCVKPSERSVSNLRGALSALRTMLTESGDVTVYFDLLKKGSTGFLMGLYNILWF